jgi:hypothetical protein
VAWKS